MRDRIYIFFGIDPVVIRQVNLAEKNAFFAVYSLLAILSATAFGGVYYLAMIISGSIFTSILIASFWAFVFFNLYRFILFLITHRKSEGFLEKVSLVMPHFFKLVTVIFFAVFSTLPILLYVQSDIVDRELPKIVKHKINVLENELNEIDKTQTTEIYKRIEKLENKITETEKTIISQQKKLLISESDILKSEISKNISSLTSELKVLKANNLPAISIFKEKLEKLKKENKLQLSKYNEIIKSSHLITERFKIIFEHRGTVTFLGLALLVFIFCIPLLFKLLSSIQKI